MPFTDGVYIVRGKLEKRHAVYVHRGAGTGRERTYAVAVVASQARIDARKGAGP